MYLWVGQSSKSAVTQSGSFSAIEKDTDHIHSYRFISETPTARDSRISAVLDTDEWGTRLKLLASMPWSTTAARRPYAAKLLRPW